jgi:hypothetical protein
MYGMVFWEISIKDKLELAVARYGIGFAINN